MKIRSALVPGSLTLSKQNGDISREASKRLKWFDYYSSHCNNARLTCRYFGISPQTFYRWKRRYDASQIKSLENKTCRPKLVRQPTYSEELVQAIQDLREHYPRWGKDKLIVLLKDKRFLTSASTVGRILHRLKERGALKEPIPNHISVHKRFRPRPYAVRKPKGYQAKSPGDIIELDTMDVRPLPGIVLKHFTAYDVTSKWHVLGIYRRATAATAKNFLDDMEKRTPYPIKAIQVDGGSEFEAVFEEECRSRGIMLFVLPPRSPKLNGGVERANRTHTEEFYEITDSSFELSDLRPKLLKWENICNTYRPNQAIDYLTPLQFLEQTRNKLKKEVRCH
jgi:putative transposase